MMCSFECVVNIFQQLEKRNALHGALGTVEARTVEQVGWVK
jgi:hypothetical protein